MNKIPTIHILRAGAPEKVGLRGLMWNAEFHDNKNLRDIDPEFIKTTISAGDYWLPSDENDYDFIQGNIDVKYHDHILLCADDQHRILPAKFVKKNSPFYVNWDYDKSGVQYPSTNFTDDKRVQFGYRKVYKSVFESGSRGVLVNPSMEEFYDFLDHHKDQPILEQDMVPDYYNKYFTFDLQIKDGKLLGFCFVNIPANSYPRWMSGYIINTEPIRKMIDKFYKYLVNYCGIYNGFINCDGAALEDYSEFMMYEINWRYSGLGNCLRAFNIDIIQNYIYGVPYSIPEGTHPYAYYYKPILLYDNFETRY